MTAPDQDPWRTRMTLLAGIQNSKDHHAWEQFYDYYSPFVLNFLKHLRLNYHERDEFHQIIFTKLWELIKNKNFPELKGKFRAWFKTVIHNEVKNYFRNNSLAREKLKDVAAYVCESTNHNDLDRWIDEEWAEFVSNKAWEKIANEFSETTKQAFILFLEGLNVAEIALRLDIKPTSVYVYKKRISDRLKEEVELLQKTHLLT